MTLRWLADLAFLTQRRGPLAFALAVFAADQVSKWWIVERVMVPPRVIEVTPFFNLVLTRNPGVTFGLLDMGGEAMRWALVAASLAVVAVVLVWLARTAKPWPSFALAAIAGAALGNIVDRVTHGKVVDFLDFHLAGWHWYAFNLADAAIVCGVAVLLIDAFAAKPE